MGARLAPLFAALAFVASACGSAETSAGTRFPGHDEPHGVAITIAEIERQTVGEIFVDEAGDEVRVDEAECVGDGAPGGKYIHAACSMTFENGITDHEVLVHVISDGLLFSSHLAWGN